MYFPVLIEINEMKSLFHILLPKMRTNISTGTRWGHRSIIIYKIESGKASGAQIKLTGELKR
jgi:hypothetical protein